MPAHDQIRPWPCSIACPGERGGVPANIRADNGPELTARVLREWCEAGSTATDYIEPGSPWQNPYAESFNARVRDELLDVEEFGSLAEAQVLATDYRLDYNANHPHSALAMMSPREQPINQPRTLIRGGPMNGVWSLRLEPVVAVVS